MKRVWELSFTDSLFVTTKYNCAICRNSLDEKCITCCAESNSENENKEYKEWCHNVLFTLLMCQKRKESPISSLTNDMLYIIFSYVIGPTITKATCPSVCLVECGHEYHRHCFDRWKIRSHTCPLDNLPNIETFEDYYGTHASISGVINDNSLYNINDKFSDRIKRRRRLEHLDAQIMKLLKPMYRENGYTIEQIFQFVYARDMKHLQDVLEGLVKRDYLKYNVQNETYIYNP